jgi:type IV pilus assembly protein PilB
MRPSWLPGSRAAEADSAPHADTRLLVGRAGGLVAIDPEASVVEVVELIITHALRDRASDVHIEPQPGRVRVRYRVDGVLHEVLELPSRMGQPVVSRIKVLAQMDIVERRRAQDGQFSLDVDGYNLDLRVATTATLSGEKCVLRLLDSAERDSSGRPARLSELGMHPETAEGWATSVASPFGMVLCTGPTGSGKTTTLYATIAELDDPGVNIMTIEDPVEYVVESVNQIQINHGIGVTFASGLKSIMRQDPDVILVGEIRDVETARIAVQSALTGHLVLSTVHATDSVSALYRFLEMGIELFLVTSSIVAVMAQRLVRRICLTCRQESEPSVGELALYYRAGGPAKTHFYAGTGCEDCAGTGYHGRVGVYELLRVTPGVRALLVAGASQDDVRALAVSEGLRTLAEDAVRLVADDVTTLTEVLRAVAAG